MRWGGWLLLVVGLYLLVILVRGVRQVVSRFVEEYITEPRELRRLKEARAERLLHPETKSVLAKESHRPKIEHKGGEDHKKGGEEHKPRASVVKAVRPAKPSPLGKLAKSLKIAAAWKGYDYWVAAALAEEDPDLKIKYLAKALKLNPSYFPAWGLQGNAVPGCQEI